MKSSDVETLRTHVSQDYPGWTIEKVYTHYSGGVLGKGAEIVVLLKWRGPQDFRARLYFVPNDVPGWTHSLPSIFQNRQDTLDFIAAFKVKHPEPGLVVWIGGDGRDVIERAGSSGELVPVAYWDSADFASTMGGLTSSNQSVDDWRATVVEGRIVWRYEGVGSL